ncbi:putative G-protein coupled receptor [Hypsibius exemplaris]|uniref:G-protein coupled receptor n=1 Tax=Hypsibius exemplaris TaxID=2072580 RepID=A0A9X6RLI9_HYPEX|nr:putative G-protein coupled receptor [Hypsibius exemplaris]
MTEDILLVTYEDDIGASRTTMRCGNIWMMTYTVPFFGFNDSTQQYHYMGTSGIDIDLRRVDIDQCPLKPGSTDKNVFAGSAKCKRTTQCEPISGLGFSRGSYVCRCVLGFYFPDKSAYDNGHAYFNGTIIEQEFEKRMQGLNSTYGLPEEYTCLPCAEGCTEGCKDNTPCIAALNWTLRIAILVAATIVMACLPVLFYFTFRYAEVKVIKAASPVLLRMLLLGALLLYGPILVLFPVPTVVTCTTRIWLRGIGFSVSYGALLLKTWRISVVFRVRSAQRVKITDNDLVKRLCLIVAMFASFLTIRTVVSPPEVKVGVTDESLKAYLCTMDYWDYSQAGGELLLLLWGIKLCFVVRKAPSEFNESKFISWAIYNEFLLSLFLNISMLFLQKYADPDLLYIIFFAHSQLTTTVVLVLLFGSKAYLVYKGLGKGSDQQTTVNPEQTRSSNKFITKKKERAKIPLTSSSASGTGTTANNDSYRGHLPGHLTPAEIQEEFKRLYLQLELLKSKNMRLGNPHLTKKLHAMTEAAMAPESSYTLQLPPEYLQPPLSPRPSTPVTPSSPSNDTVELMDEDDEDEETSDGVGSCRTKSDETLIPTTPLLRISISHSSGDGGGLQMAALLPSSASLLMANNLPNNMAGSHSGKLELNNNHVVQANSNHVVQATINHVVQANRLHPNHHPPHFDLRNSKKAFEITI